MMSASIVEHPFARPLTTTTSLHASIHNAVMGQPIDIVIDVRAPHSLGKPVGTVEVFDNGNPITSENGPLVLTLSNKGQVNYSFNSGNIALYLGRNRLTAEYISANSQPSSVSSRTVINVRTPHIRVTSDGLGLATIHPGHGAAVASGDTADLVYTAFLASTGQVVDYWSSHSTTSTDNVPLGIGFNIQGWEEGIPGMKVGETRVLAVPAQLAYGSNSQPGIPANSNLVYLITLEGFSAGTSG